MPTNSHVYQLCLLPVLESTQRIGFRQELTQIHGITQHMRLQLLDCHRYLQDMRPLPHTYCVTTTRDTPHLIQDMMLSCMLGLQNLHETGQ